MLNISFDSNEEHYEIYDKKVNTNQQQIANLSQKKGSQGRIQLLRTMSGRIPKKDQQEKQVEQIDHFATPHKKQNSHNVQRSIRPSPSNQQAHHLGNQTGSAFTSKKSLKPILQEDINQSSHEVDSYQGQIFSAKQQQTNRVLKPHKQSDQVTIKRVPSARPSGQNRNIFFQETEDDFKKKRMDFLEKVNDDGTNNNKKQFEKNTWKKQFQQQQPPTPQREDLIRNQPKKEIKSYLNNKEKRAYEDQDKEDTDRQSSLNDRTSLFQSDNEEEYDSEIQAPNVIKQQDLKDLNEKYTKYKKHTMYVTNDVIMAEFKKSISLLNTAQQNQQNIANLFNQQKVKNEIKQLKIEKDYAAKKSAFEEQIKDMSEQINLMEEQYEVLNKTNQLLHNTIKEKETIIQSQTQQNKEKEEKIEEQNRLLNQKIDEQKQQADNLANQNNELKKLQQLYGSSLQENKQLQEKVKEKETQLEKEKEANTALQKDLESAKQQSIKKQEESVQKIVDALSFDPNANQGEKLNQQIKNILTQLNPTSEIRENQVEFTKAHQIIAQNQPDDKQKSVLKVKNDQLVQSYVQNQSSNASNSNASGTMQCLLALQSMYKQDGISTFITDQPIQNLEKEDKSYKIQQAFLQTGLHSQASYYSVQVNKETNLYQELLQSSTNQNISSFLENFKNQIGKSVNASNPQTDVVIFKITFDHAPKIDFQINSQELNKEEIKKKLTLADIGVSVSEKSLLEFAKLSVDMFSPEHNMTWTDKFKGKSESRGQLEFFDQTIQDHSYHFPVGYSGYALNIQRYGADTSWISSKADKNTWIVLFHGTNENAISGITKDNLQPGSRNMYGGTLCRITNTTIKKGANANVYLTDNMDVAEQFASKSSTYEGKKYIIIFQCRVNPKGVKSPKDEPKYYTVDDNANIRPYRILLKQIK